MRYLGLPVISRDSSDIYIVSRVEEENDTYSYVDKKSSLDTFSKQASFKRKDPIVEIQGENIRTG